MGYSGVALRHGLSHALTRLAEAEKKILRDDFMLREERAQEKQRLASRGVADEPQPSERSQTDFRLAGLLYGMAPCQGTGTQNARKPCPYETGGGGGPHPLLWLRRLDEMLG